MKNRLFPLLLFGYLFFSAQCSFLHLSSYQALAEGGFEIDLGEEYTEYKRGKGEKGRRAKRSSSIGRTILLYLPNRALDVLDIFRFDVGVGPSFGGVVRLSKYVQGGYREMSPWSARVGVRGRRAPFFLERGIEKGLSPWFQQSRSRTVSPGEVGAGVDLLLVGAYFGVVLEEVGDFLAGVFLLDPKEDDYR